MNKLNILLIVSVFFASSLASWAQGPVKNAKTDTLKVNTVNDTVTFISLENELDSISTKKNNADTTKIRLGKLKIAIIDNGDDVLIKKHKKGFDEWDDWDDWGDEDKHERNFNKNFNPTFAGISFGLNTYASKNYSLTLPDTANYIDVNTNKSFEFALNFFELGIPILKHRIGIITGLGIEWNNYHLRNTNIELKGDSSIVYYNINESQVYTKNKLSVTYLTIPIMLEFQIPFHNDKIYISGGVEGSLKIGSKTKLKTDNGKSFKDKSDFHLAPFSAALCARIGFSDVGIYASYNLTPMFNDKKGPEVYPLAVGLTFNF